ncbi:hypothetical protein K0M31_005542 [Melipona bicolor]|uniref:Uncharacterized protein n=1 Tax=Melipona bicolor TaxID=60889 RepID=A0AA40FVZ3_9HYME|nr:hypothetical protein K0M31_005542 [Melipona bicolor]
MNYNRVADGRNEKDINVADDAWFASSFGSSPEKTAKLATRTRTDDISSGSFGRTELMGQNIIRGCGSNLGRGARLTGSSGWTSVASASFTKFQKYLIFAARAINSQVDWAVLGREPGLAFDFNYEATRARASKNAESNVPLAVPPSLAKLRVVLRLRREIMVHELARL